MPSKTDVLPCGTSDGSAQRALRPLRALRGLVETGVAPAKPGPVDHGLVSVPATVPANRFLRCLPNALTVSRILLAPVIGILLLRAHGRADWAAGLTFGGLALTDQFDGVLARIWQTESAFGKVVDPLADKLLIGTAVLFLVLAHRLPWLAFVLPFVRHVVLWVCRFISPRHGMLAPSWAGKLSAWMVYTGVGFVIVTSRDSWWALGLLWVGFALIFADVVKHMYETQAGQALRKKASCHINQLTARMGGPRMGGPRMGGLGMDEGTRHG